MSYLLDPDGPSHAAGAVVGLKQSRPEICQKWLPDPEDLCCKARFAGQGAQLLDGDDVGAKGGVNDRQDIRRNGWADGDQDALLMRLQLRPDPDHTSGVLSLVKGQAGASHKERSDEDGSKEVVLRRGPANCRQRVIGVNLQR